MIFQLYISHSVVCTVQVDSQSATDTVCPWFLSIEVGDTTVARETLCSRIASTGIHHGRTGSGKSVTSSSGQIECQPMADGHACAVHLDWPTGSASRNLDDDNLPIFALHYEGVCMKNFSCWGGAELESSIASGCICF